MRAAAVVCNAMQRTISIHNESVSEQGHFVRSERRTAVDAAMVTFVVDGQCRM